METFEGTIYYQSDKPCLFIEATQEKFLLMIRGNRIKKTSEILKEKGITEGKTVSVSGELAYHSEVEKHLEKHPDCEKKALIFLGKSLKEI